LRNLFEKCAERHQTTKGRKKAKAVGGMYGKSGANRGGPKNWDKIGRKGEKKSVSRKMGGGKGIYSHGHNTQRRGGEEDYNWAKLLDSAYGKH
jgi:hypothetical protein